MIALLLHARLKPRLLNLIFFILASSQDFNHDQHLPLDQILLALDDKFLIFSTSIQFA
jgi:hypothetical protein